MVKSAVQSHDEIVVGSDEKLIRVLHVDDELGLLKVAKQCLELQGSFRVDTAGSVDEALNKLKEKEYDAVVSDYQMPEKDGLEFLEMLRKNRNTIPFIMFTGKGREEVAVKAWNLGADHYVNKTGDPETVYCELAHCLRSTVEKRFAEAQTKETVQKLQTIYQNAIEGISYVDAEENVVYANKAFADMVGYEQDQLRGMNLRRIVDDENWARIECETKRRRRGESSRYEVKFRRRDGTVRDVLISGAPLLDHAGRLAGTVGIVLDITDRKQWEDALGDAHEKWVSLTENTDDIIMIVDGNGIIQFINRTIPPYTPEETIGKPVYEYVPREQHDVLKRSLKEAFRTGKPDRYEVSSSIPTVGTMWFSTKIVPIRRDGKVSGAILISANITERKKAEESLRAREERYRSYIEVTGQLGWTTNANGEVEEDIPVWREYTGQSYEEAKGWGWTKALHPDDLGHTTQVWEKAVAEESSYEVEYRMRRYDGVYHYFIARGVPVLDKDGKVQEWVGTCIDITERKKAEQTLKESEEKYRGLVELAPDGIVAVNVEGIITSANRSFLALVGL